MAVLESMKRVILANRLVVGLAVIFGISLLGFSSCVQSGTQPAANGSTVMADNTLNNIMHYIEQKHPDTAPFIKENITWARSGSVKRVGYTEATYDGNGWTVTIGHAVTAELIYEVRAEYHSAEIVWTGTVKNDTITEESYARK
jgi:hypothetical protein